MKLIVFAHRLEIGGTQTNAIDLAATLSARHGYHIIVHAAPGPMCVTLEEKGLRYVPAPDVRFHPAPARIKALRDLVRQEKPDLIHAWDWWQGLEAYAGTYMPWGVPLLISDMMMTLTRVLPKNVPTTFGLPEIRDTAAQAGWQQPDLMLPPVNVAHNAPGFADGRQFRRQLGIEEDAILAVSVSRLSKQMKSEPLIRSIETIKTLGADCKLTLVIVGDGEAQSDLEVHAKAMNDRLRRRAIVFAGPMLDPRSAYDAADFVLGMGGSALRGLAFAKPLIVVGENGFARLFSSATAPQFLHGGFYGRGDGTNDELAVALRTVAARHETRQELGQFGRAFVVFHFGIEAISDDFARLCAEVVSQKRSFARAAVDLPRLCYVYLRERRFATASRDANGSAKSQALASPTSQVPPSRFPS